MDDKYSVFGAARGLIIESDNLTALQTLGKYYAGKVNVILTDPPYNTEINYIEYKDSEFENGWSEFMRPRIAEAYKLLNATGVMFIHIDENELLNLYILCQKTFKKKNVNILVWKKTDKNFDEKRIEKPTVNIRRIHEYIILCYKDKTKTLFNKIKKPARGEEMIEQEQYLESILDGFGTTTSAKNELHELFESPNVFSTPKPMRLAKELIRVAGSKDSIVLDFFAGSGTVGHAAMDLNKEDGGTRKFILITNNESNICCNVTIPRIQKAIDKNKYEEKFKII